jgi:hypothetical protein
MRGNHTTVCGARRKAVRFHRGFSPQRNNIKLYMPAYHVSPTKYELGEIVNSNTYNDVTELRGNGWVEQLLENHRPQHYPKRSDCVFTFDNLDALGYYADYLIGDLIYYEVELLDVFYSFPMCLCGFIQQRREESEDYLSSLAAEYWANTMEWNYYEQLCSSFRIERIISKPTIWQKLTGMGMYKNDLALAAQIL